MRRAVSFLALVMSLAACTDSRVTLSYGSEEPRRLQYRLTLVAQIDRTLAGDTRHQVVEADFDAVQEIIEPLPAGGGRALMALEPRRLVVDGRGLRVGPRQEFLVTLGPDGAVVDIDRASGQAAEALEGVGIERLLPRLRPVLPEGPVRTGDRWRAETRFTDESGRFSLDLTSRLARLGLTGGHRAALVRTTYESPVSRREAFANAVADVRGRDFGVQQTWFALDGFLVRSSGDSLGRYTITFRPPGRDTGLAPVEGALVVRLHTEMALAA